MGWFKKDHQRKLYSDKRTQASVWANMPQIHSHSDDEWEVIEVCAEQPSLEDFEILGVVGHGGCAEVYKARCKRTDKVVALKVMEKQVYFDARKLKPEAIMRERDIMVNVANSDFFAKLYTAFQTETQVVLVQEFLPNGDLFHYVQRQPEMRLDEATVQFIAAQLLVGLSSLHERGILYRDLKMENILLDEAFNVKLADFGLSRYLEDARCFSFAGTSHFIAPEMIKRSGYAASVDYWALGILLYGLLTGSHAFGGETIEELFKNIVRDSVEFPNPTPGGSDAPVISPEAQAFVLALLTKNPRDRLMGEDVFAHPWFASVNWADIRGRAARPPPTMDMDFSPKVPAAVKTGTAAMLGKPVAMDKRLSPKQQLAFLNFDYRSEECLDCSSVDDGATSEEPSSREGSSIYIH
eukprot:TRINITY_DN32352_c0_g1_i1.p1 TRINITY_DN32352_c0_g1~~TRINITY_DN32352_c0_g1_i1.p1  ORF type:complete len:410 (+),score=184.97 TRINITY_DN32352_c0_g1_i1:76-1305(+)